MFATLCYTLGFSVGYPAVALASARPVYQKIRADAIDRFADGRRYIWSKYGNDPIAAFNGARGGYALLAATVAIAWPLLALLPFYMLCMFLGRKALHYMTDGKPLLSRYELKHQAETQRAYIRDLERQAGIPPMSLN